MTETVEHLILKMRAYRQLNAWRQYKLEQKIHVAMGRISVWEHHRETPSLDNFFSWVEALDLEITLTTKDGLQL